MAAYFCTAIRSMFVYRNDRYGDVVRGGALMLELGGHVASLRRRRGQSSSAAHIG